MIILIGLFLGFLLPFFIYWLGGRDFVRGTELALTFTLSLGLSFFGALLGALTYDTIKAN
jgi:hypothetical protein